MARKAKKSAPSTLPTVAPPVPMLPLGTFGGSGFGLLPQQPQVTLEPRTFKQVKDAVAEYRLDDGTTLTIRVVLIDVKRVKDRYGPDGKPVYVVVSTDVPETRSPARLLKQSADAVQKAKRKGRGRKK